ncbi:MAG: hypothetical protein ACT4NY_10680 [Pseudonocardiales bacterium]
MQAIRLSMPAHARLTRDSTSPDSASHRSEPTIPAPRSGRLATRDHRDDGSLIGGLIVMLAVTLPLWAMVIILVSSLVW